VKAISIVAAIILTIIKDNAIIVELALIEKFWV
jgi:hypothetical protein